MARALTRKRYAQLEALLDADAQGPDSGALSQVLSAAPGVLVARAARLAADLGRSECIEALESTYTRLCEEPLGKGADADAGCRGKLAIVEALRVMEARAGDVFIRAVRYTQPEPQWGEPVDTAVSLRCAALAGLVEMNHQQALLEAARLLADAEPTARRNAAECVGELDGLVDANGPIALLHLKALHGDVEPEVLQACLSSLLNLAPDDSLDFVCQWLDAANESDAEAAAFALAGARDNHALQRLVEWYETEAASDRRRTALTAIALARLPRGFDYLFEVMQEGSLGAARNAVEALSVYAGDSTLLQRARQTAEARDDDALRALVESSLDS